eukprot:PLAT12399.1.p1 GENE.PLAT12399.1~~PLAT12399.1.p1  ORF type:complete len:197 (+),score=38.60 PLAT12399.1:22-612(+)
MFKAILLLLAVAATTAFASCPGSFSPSICSGAALSASFLAGAQGEVEGPCLLSCSTSCCALLEQAPNFWKCQSHVGSPIPSVSSGQLAASCSLSSPQWIVPPGGRSGGFFGIPRPSGGTQGKRARVLDGELASTNRRFVAQHSSDSAKSSDDAAAVKQASPSAVEPALAASAGVMFVVLIVLVVRLRRERMASPSA